MYRLRAFAITLLGLALVPGIASAHAFGQNFTLPLPAWLYIYGGGAVVLLSFVLIGLVTGSGQDSYPTADLSKSRLVGSLTTPSAQQLYRIIAWLLFGFILSTGFFDNPLFAADSLLVVIFWIIFLLGFTYLVALFGNFWQVINPWAWLAGALKLAQPRVEYPRWLGYYPALVFYAYLVWLELLSGGRGVSAFFLLALFATYTLINLAGSYLFGRETWFKQGEFFSVFFRVVSAISIFEKDNGRLKLRPPFVGIAKFKMDHSSLILFILFMLSSTAFDGFKETRPWSDFIIFIVTHFPSWAVSAYEFIRLLVLIISPLVFYLIYIGAIGLLKLLVGSKQSLAELARHFAPSLIPIAVAYNFAHYFSLLVTQGQRIIPLLSDPYHRGWNLFHTRSYQINVGLVPIGTIWNVEVAAIVIGHVVAVYIAHLESFRLLKIRRQAILSQLPMLLVMIIYTMIGLWILAQPFSVGV